MRALLPVFWLALLALGGAGCDRYDRPNKPIPTGFKATLLDGTLLDHRSFQGKPWVVNIWVPG